MKREVEFKLRSGEMVTIPYLGKIGKKRLSPISQALSSIDGSGQSLISVSVDLGHELGNTHHLQTNHESNIVYAKMTGSDRYSRFVRDMRPKRCRHLSVVLDYLPDDHGESAWTLRKHFLAEKAALQPGENGFSRSDETFWRNHGIWFAQNKVQLGTVTKEIPEDFSFLR